MNSKPLSPLTRLLAVLLKINIGIAALAVVAGIYGYIEYATLAPGVDPTETLLPSDVLNAVLGVIQVSFFIFLGITFLRWIHRANKNLHCLSTEVMRLSPGWAIGWYFIPVANLFKPY